MITLERARELLWQAVQTQGPDFIYNPGGVHSCYNVPLKDAPAGDPKAITGCLVGTAMSLSGEIAPEHMHFYEVGGVSTFNDYLTAKAAMYFGLAQIKQDRGSTWGEAYEAAEAFAAEQTREEEQ